MSQAYKQPIANLVYSSVVDYERCPNCGNDLWDNGEIMDGASAFRWQYCDCGWQSDMRGYRLIQYQWGTSYEFDPSLLPEAALFQKLRGKFRVDPTAFRFSESSRQLVWQGTIYALTANQTAIVKVLYEQRARGAPDVDKSKLMRLAGIPTSAPRDSFRRRNNELWGKLIIHKPGSRQGTLRLDL